MLWIGSRLNFSALVFRSQRASAFDSSKKLRETHRPIKKVWPHPIETAWLTLLLNVHPWRALSFYNEEAETALKEHLSTKKSSRSKRLFPMQRDEVVELWKVAKEKTDINITPQKLRQWFCSEMLRLGVSETYVDAFCGRMPKSVLARHYTDFSPEKLKDIYEKASLRLLDQSVKVSIDRFAKLQFYNHPRTVLATLSRICQFSP